MSISDCHVLNVRTRDIANGEGIRVSVWFAGCIHHCKGCHNPSTWKWKQGKPLDTQLINKILDACSKEHIAGMTLTGGDPLFVKNIDGILALCQAFRDRFKNQKTIWLWTGYKYEDIPFKEVLPYIDVLIDGKFVEELKDPSLKYRGSSNQKVIYFR